eukprot:COSAG02_NODE_3625_length_6453_cov_4.201448_4_plen_263_part_00
MTESVHSICSFGPSGIIGSTPHCQHLAELPNRVVPALGVFQRQRRRDVLPNRLAVGSAARIRDHQRKQQHQEGAVPHHTEHVLRSENLTPAGRCPLLRAAVVGRLARGPAESHRARVGPAGARASRPGAVPPRSRSVTRRPHIRVRTYLPVVYLGWPDWRGTANWFPVRQFTIFDTTVYSNQYVCGFQTPVAALVAKQLNPHAWELKFLGAETEGGGWGGKLVYRFIDAILSEPFEESHRSQRCHSSGTRVVGAEAMQLWQL